MFFKGKIILLEQKLNLLQNVFYACWTRGADTYVGFDTN